MQGIRASWIRRGIDEQEFADLRMIRIREKLKDNLSMQSPRKRKLSALSILPGRNPVSTDASRLDPAAGPETDLRKAVFFMILAVSLFSLLDSTAKLSGQVLPTLEVVWLRFAIHFVFVALILNPWRSPETWRLSSPQLQVMRAMIQIFCTGLNFLALGYLQIAQTLSIQFAGPIFVTLLSILILREKVGINRWIGILIGFSGVLIVTRPGLSGFHWAFAISLCSVIVGAGYNILTRRLSATDSPGSMLLTMAGLPFILLTPIMPFIWEWPGSPKVWAIIIAMGGLGALSHYFMIAAHRYAPASFLAPIQYVQFVAVLIAGYAIFGDIPDAYTYVGGGVVIFSGLFIWWRERVVARRKAASA